MRLSRLSEEQNLASILELGKGKKTGLPRVTEQSER